MKLALTNSIPSITRKVVGAVSTQDLKFWYKFSGNGEDSFTSGRTLAPTIASFVDFVEGRIGEAIEFNSTLGDMSGITTPNLVITATEFTMGMWINLASIPALFSVANPSGYLMSIANSGTTVRHTWKAGPAVDITIPQLVVGRWYFLTWGYNSTDEYWAKLDDNARLTEAGDLLGGDVDTAGLTLGSLGISAPGIYDEFWCFNRALSDAELATIKANGGPYGGI